MEVKPGLRDPANLSLSPEVSLQQRKQNYKDFVNIFPEPNFVSLEWRYPLNRGVLKARFHCRFFQKHYLAADSC